MSRMNISERKENRRRRCDLFDETMTQSKRQYSRDRRVKEAQNIEEEERRKVVADSLRANPIANKTQLSQESGVNRRTVQRIAKALRENETDELERLLKVRENRPGRSPVLSMDEESMICERIQYCAARGFPVYADELPSIMADIASDGRDGYVNGKPIADTVRYFRARHGDKITLRKGQKKDASKLLAEHPAHAETYKTILEAVIEANPHFKTSPEYIWNMDETEIDARGKVRKMFCAAGPSSTGFDSNPHIANGAHLTCVVTTSPSGEKLPPFFIIAGKMIMKRWWDPLRRRANRTGPINPDIEQYFRENWMPEDAGIAVSENGSMTSELLPLYIKHLIRNARKYAPDENLPLLLLIDGHKSRKGIEWIQEAMRNSIELVQSPANTSHYLQSNDQKVNLCMNRAGKLVRDVLVKESDMPATNINFKLIKGVHSHAAINADIVRSSWTLTGLWPMDYRFVQIARDAWDGRAAQRAENEPFIDLTVERRESDESICERLKIIVNDDNISPERRLQQASMLLHNSQSANRILMDIQPGTSAPPRDIPRKNYGIKPPKGAGAPALYLTSKEYISAFEEKKKEENRKELEKQKRKEERERKAAEKAKKRELKEQAQLPASKKSKSLGGEIETAGQK